jgi:tetratricopeptide (TPR) repeat protein
VGLLCIVVLLFLAGCNRIARSWYLGSYDREISSATKSIESARDNIERSAAHSKRGSAYSEKARYSRAFQLISMKEYERLFGLAIKDHDEAVALNPSSSEAYLNRGETYYDRASQEVVVNGILVGNDAARKNWFEPAIADFKKAVEKDGRQYLAWDRLGLSHETTGELDLAISDYTQEMALNPLGRMRLADAYCARGGSTKQPKSAPSIADYEKSIELGATADGCYCDPYNPLLGLYEDGRQYDQAWSVVARAKKSGKYVAPELLDRLKRESGRSN